MHSLVGNMYVTWLTVGNGCNSGEGGDPEAMSN